MKKLMGVLLLIGCVFIFNIHVIRDDTGINILLKNDMKIRHTFVDLKNIEFIDFFDYDPVIQNYIIKKKYKNIKQKLDFKTEKYTEEKGKLKQIYDNLINDFNNKFSDFEKIKNEKYKEFNDWLEMIDKNYIQKQKE